MRRKIDRIAEEVNLISREYIKRFWLKKAHFSLTTIFHVFTVKPQYATTPTLIALEKKVQSVNGLDNECVNVTHGCFYYKIYFWSYFIKLCYQKEFKGSINNMIPETVFPAEDISYCCYQNLFSYKLFNQSNLSISSCSYIHLFMTHEIRPLIRKHFFKNNFEEMLRGSLVPHA